MYFISIVIAFVLLAGLIQDKSYEKALQSLVAAEENFAAASGAKGIRTAFLENLHPDGIIFTPGPANGRVVWEKQPESASHLTWYPAFAAVARSQDWGFTTGPYELRKLKTGLKPAGAGFYITVWKKYNNQWKAIIDKGNHYAPSEIKPEKLILAPAGKSKAKGNKAALLHQDTLQQQPFTPETRIYLPDSYPYQLKEKGRQPQQVKYKTLGADIAASGDMAFTYGEVCSAAQTKPGYYLKIWQMQDDKWILLVYAAD